MASEQGHWITYQGRKIFISDDPIEKQYREISEQENRYIYAGDNAPKTSYKATYDTEPDTYPGKSEKSKKYIAEVSKVIDEILKGAKRDEINADSLEDYIWDRLGDNYSSSPYGDDEKVVSNNGGEYDKDGTVDIVAVSTHIGKDGKLRVSLSGKSYFMSEFTDEELEQMGIYKWLS